MFFHMPTATISSPPASSFHSRTTEGTMENAQSRIDCWNGRRRLLRLRLRTEERPRMLDWEEFRRRVDAATHVMLTTHVRPDGDALGSELAFRRLLLAKGKRVSIFNPGTTPPRYQFLDPSGEVIRFLSTTTPQPPATPDLLVVLDTGTWSQLPGLKPLFDASNAPKVVVDHHQTQDDLGALRIVDVKQAACGMLVYQAFKEFDVPIDEEAAEALFIAVATDTGWMHHPNAGPEVFNALAEFVGSGAKPNRIYRSLYETNSLARLRLLGRVLDKIKLLQGGSLATVSVTQTDIADVGAHPMDTEDFIVYLMSLDGVESAVLFIEQKDRQTTKVSFRSRGTIDCSKLAERFAGGGHKPAAGATIKLPLEEAESLVLDAVNQAIAAS
jgi:bifunctional oligoribonuclease and PAP phosphatase NrnA